MFCNKLKTFILYEIVSGFVNFIKVLDFASINTFVCINKCINTIFCQVHASISNWNIKLLFL